MFELQKVRVTEIQVVELSASRFSRDLRILKQKLEVHQLKLDRVDFIRNYIFGCVVWEHKIAVSALLEFISCLQPLSLQDPKMTKL